MYDTNYVYIHIIYIERDRNREGDRQKTEYRREKGEERSEKRDKRRGKREERRKKRYLDIWSEKGNTNFHHKMNHIVPTRTYTFK